MGRLVPIALLLACLTARAHAAAPELVVQRGHAKPVTSLCVSPDGLLVATGSRDDTIRVWDAVTGEEIRVLSGHGDDVTAVAFSPDSTRLASGSKDDSVRVWRLDDGETVLRLDAHAFPVTAIAFSPDGATLVSGSQDHHVVHWDLDEGKELRRLGGRPDYAPVTSVAFASDGRHAVSGHLDGTARMWDLRRGKEVRSFAAEGGAEVTALDLADGGGELFTGHDDGSLLRWDTRSGALLGPVARLDGPATAVDLSADGRRALGSGGEAVHVWELGGGGATPTRMELGQRISDAAFSADGGALFAAVGNHTTRLPLGGGRAVPLHGRTEPVRAVSFLEGGQLIVTAGRDDLVQLRQSMHGSLVRRVGRAHGGLAVSRDGRRLASCEETGEVRLWDLAAGEETAVLRGHTDRVHAVAFSEDGGRVLTGGADGSVRLWDAASGDSLRVLAREGRIVEAVGFSADGRLAISGGWGEATRVWDMDSGEVRLELRGHTHYVGAVAFSPDGLLAATGGGDNTVRIWDLETGQERLRLDAHDNAVQCLAFSPAGGKLLSGGGEGTARLWDVKTGRVVHAWTGHGDAVTSVSFSLDGRLAATSSHDGTARLWDLDSGAVACWIVALADGAWASIDPLGRFDGARPVRGLHWVVGREPVALWQTGSRYFQPGLLGAVLRGDPIEDVPPFRAAGLHPVLHAQAPAPGTWELQYTVEPRSGGVGQTRLFLNGREVDAQPAQGGRTRDAPVYSVDLSAAPSVFPGQANEIRVVPCTDGGDLCGRETVLQWYAPGTAVHTPQRLWAIVAGASRLRGDDGVELRYASRDARALAEALEGAAGRHFGPQNVQVTTLTDLPGDEPATAANLRAAFEALKASAPDDVLVVYYAGYSVEVDPTFGHLALIPSGMNATSPAVPEGVVTAAQIAQWSQGIPASSRLIVLDTCAAGPPVARLSEAAPTGGEVSRAAHLLHDQGGFVTAVARVSDQASYEATGGPHGWWTSAALEVMADGGTLEAGRLLADTNAGVEAGSRYAAGVGTPVVSGAEAAFAVGRSADRSRPDTPDRPVLERPEVTWRGQAYDALELEDRMAETLRGLLWTGGEAVAYVDAAGVPGAYRPVVEYRMDNRTVELTAELRLDGEAQMTLERTASRDALDELAMELAVWSVEATAALASAAP